MVRKSGGLVFASLLLGLLAGCGSGSRWSPAPIEVVPPSPVVTEVPNKLASLLPDDQDAIKADAYEAAQFASPSGRIWCSVDEKAASCRFPRGMDARSVPPATEVCQNSKSKVTTVVVTQATTTYSCDREDPPGADVELTGWWSGLGVPEVTYAGSKVAVLPYGRKLAKGEYVCLSAKTGVICGNTTTGKGFRLAMAGVTSIG